MDRQHDHAHGLRARPISEHHRGYRGVAGWVLLQLLGISTIDQGNFSLSALAVSLLGAVILLGVVNLFRRGAVR